MLNWLEKNKDPLNDTAVTVLKKADMPMLKAIWKSFTTQEEMAEIIKAEKAEKGTYRSG